MAVCLAAMLALFGSIGMAQDKSGYKVGDRLPAKSAAKAAVAKPSPFKLLTWDDLLPPDWDPMKGFKDVNLQDMSDADPRAMKLLDELREWWDKAPVRQDLNKTLIRIPGFVIPLERQKDRMTEFLVVPYFGACIHTPPPPSNQMIHAIAERPVAGFRSMDPAWINGEIQTIRSDTGFGAASYRMKVTSVERYKGP
ncbi:MAG: DUF3299 domain-containing protein [Burkholderiales bacterium]